jgi:hypothetical protein
MKHRKKGGPAHSRRRLRTRPSCARQPMISLPAFVACEPGRVDAVPGSIAVERRDALGFDLVIAVGGSDRVDVVWKEDL